MSARATFAGILLLAVACTAGSGPAVPVETENREPPTVTNEPGAQGPDPGSGEYESPNGSTGACPACNYVYLCTTTEGLESQSTSVSLVEVTTPDGTTECLYSGDNDSIFECSGFVLLLPNESPAPVSGGSTPSAIQVPWSPYGAGGFSIDYGGVSATCLPQMPYVAPQGGDDGGVTVKSG